MRPDTVPADSRRHIRFRMSSKDLINVGIFAALYVVTIYAINLLGFVNPAVMIAALCASIVAGGIPFMLFVTRVRHAGMVFLFGLIVSIVMTFTGHPLVSFAVTLAAAAGAEVALWAGRYASRAMGVVAYAVFAAWNIGPMLPIFYMRDAYFSSASMRQMGPDYLAQMEALISPSVLIAFDAGTVVFGLLGGLLGVRLLRKHFTRAGLA